MFICAPINMPIFLILSVITCYWASVDTANILAVFPVPSISHQVVFRPITQELAKRGHNVTVVTPNPAFTKEKSSPRLTEIDVHDISYKLWAEIFMKISKGNKADVLTQAEVLLESFTLVVDAILKTKEVQKILNDKEKKFDLLLLEACVRSSLGFSHVFKVPAVFISSLGAAPGNFELMGASEHPIIFPNLFHQKLYNLTMWEKFLKLYGHYQIMKIYEKSAKFENKVLRKHFGDSMPSVEELGNNVDLLLLNINPVFDGSHPVPPNIVYMGGLHQKPEKPLPASAAATSMKPEPSKAPHPAKDDGFVTVQRRKRRQRTTKNRCGTAPAQFTIAIRAAKPNTPVYISRLHYTTKAENIVEYLRQKINYTPRVQLLESYRNVNFLAFVVRVPDCYLHIVMEENFCPQGVMFRRFRGQVPHDRTKT